MVMTGQVKERAALGNFRTPRPGSTETEQPRHGAGRGAALDPFPRRATAGGTSALHPGPASASAGVPTQNHYLLSHPKAVVRRPTCPLGPPYTACRARTGPRSQSEGPAGAPCPMPRPPPLTAGLSCCPGAPTCDPVDSWSWEQPGPVEVSLRPDETPKETRVGSGGLGFNTPLPPPRSRGAAL